ncbi:M4 family metallopeptidase [Staphylococcus caeli]|uniref:M4 family metallopeptidase n=1 Tax=Staphylococcus caeli TaxID=2201815 RepID=UPI003F55C66C
MKKVLTTTLATCALISLSSFEVQAEEKNNSIKPESLKQPIKTKINNDNDVKAYLQKNAGKLVSHIKESKSITNEDQAFKQYEITDKKQDTTGITHYTLKPKVNGVIAEDSAVKVHVNESGNVTLINGDIDKPNIEVNNQTKISEADAENQAFKAIDKTKKDVKNLKGYDIVSKNKLNINSDSKKYVYDIEINYISPKAAHWKIQVDASTGEVLKKDNVINNAAATGKGIGVNNDVKSPLNLTESNGVYTLKDTTQNAEMHTVTANNTKTNFSEITNNNNYFNKSSQKAGVDAHYYANEVYNYYLNHHGRDSYDNAGAQIDSVVHYGNNYNNAAWTGQYMIYGDGDGQSFQSLSGANDIIAHELTHAVTERTANLVYQDQPGALNESFSDVFGYFVDSEDWLMGEDVYTPGRSGDALRSMKDPEQYNQPAHMDQYYHGRDDYGGVHTNSGIPNKAAYLTISKIGEAKAEQIYYLALTQYLTQNSEFSDAKVALKEAAKELYGANSPEVNAIDKAWTDVGVN